MGCTYRQEYGHITPRVAQALDLLCRGLTYQQIAQQMGLSYHTAKNLLQVGYRNLDCTNCVQAALVWSQVGFPEVFTPVNQEGRPQWSANTLLADGCFE